MSDHRQLTTLERLAQLERGNARLRARITELTQGWEADRVELERVKKEVAHWKNNHRCEVERARVLKERTDMPLERVKAYEQIGNLQSALAEMETQRDQWHRLHDELAEKGCAHVMHLQSALSRCRADALEEAARVAHDRLVTMGYGNRAIDVQDAIRALQITPPSPSYAAGMEAVEAVLDDLAREAQLCIGFGHKLQFLHYVLAKVREAKSAFPHSQQSGFNASNQ